LEHLFEPCVASHAEQKWTDTIFVKST